MLKVINFMSRNKDNKEIEGFRPRSKFIVTERDVKDFEDEWREFVDGGVDGEFSRFYVAVNERDEGKVRKKMMIRLLEHEPAMTSATINNTLVSCAMQKECAVTKKWLIDFDGTNEQWYPFLKDLCDYAIDFYHYPTVHGRGVVVNHGFDTRDLIKKYGDIITIHKDGFELMTFDYKK